MIGEGLAYMADVFTKSGPIGCVTVLILFVCFGVGLERLLFWGRLWGPASVLRLLFAGSAAREESDVEELVRQGRFRAAGVRATRSHAPVLRLMGRALAGLRCPVAWHSTRDHVLAATLGCNVTLGRRFLITAIQAFGLLGMLGTCTGLYAQLGSFGADAGPAAIEGTMSGMGEAFTTTLVGLMAAALATLIYLPNEMAIEHFERELRRVNSLIEAALAERGARAGAPRHAQLG